MEEIKKSQAKLEELERIRQMEINGEFDKDSGIDPPTLELKPDMIDYLKKKPINAIKNKIANFLMKKGVKKFIKNKQIIIKEVIGAEKLNSVKNGAIITCNHFNPFDNFAVEHAFNMSKKKHKHLWKIIREGNYTNPPCFNFFFKNCNVLPLSSNSETMKKKHSILIYPEQGMWWNYRQPRPLKQGAFRFAVNSNVPVVPMFITMADTDIIDPDGFPLQEYTVHVFDPIYPDENLDKKANINMMMDKNYQLWCDKYEEVYGKKVEYNTKK